MEVIEARAIMIKRLKMRSMRRGIKEMDLILSHFAQATLDQMTEEELVNYELFLAGNDHERYSWVTGAAAADAELAPLNAQIVAGLQISRSSIDRGEILFSTFFDTAQRSCEGVDQ